MNPEGRRLQKLTKVMLANSDDVRLPMWVPKTARLRNPGAMCCPTAAGTPKEDDIVITGLWVVFVDTEDVCSVISLIQSTINLTLPDTSVMLYQGGFRLALQPNQKLLSLIVIYVGD